MCHDRQHGAEFLWSAESGWLSRVFATDLNAMKIVVSACLLGEDCRYDGGSNRCQRVIDFVKGHEVTAVCPERMGGLPTPRVPAEICCGKVVNAEGVCVDEYFRKGAQEALKTALERGVEMAILQPRSPSCGCRQVYDGTFSRTLIPGQGVFAKLLSDHGVKVLEPEELGE